jgi:hypothetical protein
MPLRVVALSGHARDAPPHKHPDPGAASARAQCSSTRAPGPLLDDEAALAALDDGRLFAAGLDVHAGGPELHPGHRARRNWFRLPHLGSATEEARDAMGFACLDNLEAIFRGEPAPDAVA